MAPAPTEAGRPVLRPTILPRPNQKKYREKETIVAATVRVAPQADAQERCRTLVLAHDNRLWEPSR